MKTLYPEIEAYNTFKFKVSDIHELYVEEAGNPQGQPVVFLHGGPGGGIEPKHRRYFNPEKYRIILFDQRGSGKSTPHACLDENTTWDLVNDIEKIREHLKINKWLVFGGSWGSTLSLAYAETHPDKVTGLILRGIFLCRPQEIQWFYQKGCDWIYPDLFEEYQSIIPEDERDNMVAAYYKRLISDNEQIKMQAAQAWSKWEGATARLIYDKETVDSFTIDHTALSIARIECHYFYNNCFFRNNNQLVEDTHKIQDIPTTIIHGRYDVICPAKNAWELHKALPKSKLIYVADAGHSASEVGITDALVSATDDF